GQALAGAVELGAPGTLVFQEDFDSGVIPASFSYDAAHVFVTQVPEKVITGKASAVFSNPDHTQMNYVSLTLGSDGVQLAPAKTYLVSFDWRILSTVDTSFSVSVLANNQSVDGYRLVGSVTGDSGTSQFPLS